MVKSNGERHPIVQYVDQNTNEALNINRSKTKHRQHLGRSRTLAILRDSV